MNMPLEVTFKTYRVYKKSEDLFLAFIYYWYKLSVLKFERFSELFVLLISQDNCVWCAFKAVAFAICILTINMNILHCLISLGYFNIVVVCDCELISV